MTSHPKLGSTFENKKVLVAGGTGMVGQQLVRLLYGFKAKVWIASLDDPSMAPPEAEDFWWLDLTDKNNCYRVCEGMDFIFNLLCVKGSPAVTRKYPNKFTTPMLRYNSFLTEAAFKSGAGYLLTSTNGIYGPSDIMQEDNAWKTVPSENDKFAGYVKRMAELELESYIIEYGWKNTSIVRPANIYGPYDNFDSENAMVVPSLIKKAINHNGIIEVWGDGSQRRDLIHSRDVARGMIIAVERLPGQAVNIGSGGTHSIRELVKIILKNINPRPEVFWDTSKPSGDAKRFLDTSRVKSVGFEPEINLKQGIKETLEWYLENRNKTNRRYDIFDKK